MTEYELTIGLEVHVQLKTNSKMFCSCSADYFGADPNTHVCPVCLGLPGALPVANQEAIRKAIMVGLALNCEVPEVSKFDRKNYFYPDLAKGFQISQFDQPFSINGHLEVEGRKIRINRAHLEEDTGKLIHGEVQGKKVSLIDFNRSGVPLLEIVSEPDITSPVEAKSYAQKLNLVMRSLGVAEVDMEKAGMRFDANISIRPAGQKEYGTKVEIKNINSFRFLEKAVTFEYRRQVEAVTKGEKIVQETRGWNESKGITQSQRTKEFAHDYRYFPEPDLTNHTVTGHLLKELKDSLKLLPDEMEKKLVADFGLDPKTALVIVEKEGLYSWYQQAVDSYQQTESKGIKSTHIDTAKAVKVSNWVTGELLRVLKNQNQEVKDLEVEPAGLAQVLYLIDQNQLTTMAAKKVFEDYLQTGDSIEKIAQKYRQEQVSFGNLEEKVDQAIEKNPSAVTDYLSGKEQSLFFLLGQVVRETKGSAEPGDIKELLVEKLSARKNQV